MNIKSLRLHTPGQQYHDFTLVKAVEITELQCVLRELIHEPTGALVISITNEDPENLFCLSFKTLPDSSNGAAHILEHTVLCGSEKYPVKDPFFAMSRRSLNTFMNALTGADFTCYPASSQVEKDFYNLLEVYLDAVFHPKLNHFSFLQEGHRIEFTEPDNPKSPLQFKGIVYNEMKGAMASSSSRLSEAIHEALFPDVTYGVNSGGDPRVIPDLSYEELCAFYQKFYHPARCLFFFYGNLPLEGHLDFIAEKTLNKTEKIAPLSSIPLQPRFREPRIVEKEYPIGRDEETLDKTIMAFSWLTCSILDQETLLALIVLEVILLDNDSSILKKALLKSGWCKQVSSFIDDELNEIPWGITVKGCNPNHAEDLEKLIFDTLRSVVAEGIPIEQIENAIHQLEFFRTEITGDHAPFGLSLFFRSGLQKQHGADSENGLMIHSLFNKLRQCIVKDPGYLTKLIETQFINNPHFARVVLKPSRELAEKELLLEKNKLEKLAERLSKKEKEDLVLQATELAEFQKKQAEENFDVLPKVTLQDVPLGARDYTLSQEKVGILDVYHHAVFTNDIIYADVVLDLPAIPEDDFTFLRLWMTVLTQVGCNERNYLQNLEYIQANTGGISAGFGLNPQASDSRFCKPTIHLRGKALHRKASKLFPLLQETLSEPDFTNIDRLKEILEKHYTGLESQLNQNALKYAVNLSSRGLSVPSKIADELYGISYYQKIRELVKDFDKQAPFIVSKLQQLHKTVTGLENPKLIIGCDSASYNEFKNEQFYSLQDMETKPFKKWTGEYPLRKVTSQGRVIASPVAFIGKVFPAVSYIHPDAPAIHIAAHLFDNITLHAKIREQGGAYGGGAVSNATSGNFYFYSYRDPNIISSVEAFHESIEAILNGEFDEADLEEAKLEMIQGLDSPVSPGSRAEVAFGRIYEGKTLEMRQDFRNRLLSLEAHDVKDAVTRHIVHQFKEGATVVFAGRDLLEKENRVLKAAGLPELPIKQI